MSKLEASNHRRKAVLLRWASIRTKSISLRGSIKSRYLNIFWRWFRAALLESWIGVQAETEGSWCFSFIACSQIIVQKMLVRSQPSIATEKMEASSTSSVEMGPLDVHFPARLQPVTTRVFLVDNWMFDYVISSSFSALTCCLGISSSLSNVEFAIFSISAVPKIISVFQMFFASIPFKISQRKCSGKNPLPEICFTSNFVALEHVATSFSWETVKLG